MRGCVVKLVEIWLAAVAFLLSSTVWATDFESLPKAGAKNQARPDWLDRAAIQYLLIGNTISSFTDDGRNGYRYWIHFYDHKAMTWKNDRGKSRNGIWFVSDDEKFCAEWGFSTECYGVRHTGKVVRFDHSSTGKERWAAKLLKGDPKNLHNDFAQNNRVPPAAEPRTSSDQEVSSSSSKSVADLPTVDGATSPTSGSMTIEVVGDGIHDPEDAIVGLAGVQMAKPGETPDVVWNLAKTEIRAGPRVIAYLNTNSPNDVQAVVDRWLLLEDIQSMSADRNVGLSLYVRPERSSFSAGEEIVLSLSGHDFEYNMLFNVGPNGGIDIIYPTRTDFRREGAAWPTLPPGLPFALSLVAGPPFGVNHVVVVSSPSAPEDLLQLLRRAAVQRGARVANNDIIDAVGMMEGQIFVSGLYVYP